MNNTLNRRIHLTHSSGRLNVKDSGIVTWNDAVVGKLVPSLTMGGLALSRGLAPEDPPSEVMIPTMPPCSNVDYVIG